MLDQYLKHTFKPYVPDTEPVKLILTPNARQAMMMLTDITLKGATDKDFLQVMTRIHNALTRAFEKKSLEVTIGWADFKTFHVSLEKKMANPKVEEPIEGKLAQQELLDACYEAEYQTLSAKKNK